MKGAKNRVKIITQLHPVSVRTCIFNIFNLRCKKKKQNKHFMIINKHDKKRKKK